KFWRAKFIFAVMAHNQMLDERRKRLRKIGNHINFSLHHSETNDDMSEQLPFVRVSDRARIGKLLRLADVVEHDTREEQVAVDFRIMLGDVFRKSAQTDDVFQQTAQVR